MSQAVTEDTSQYTDNKEHDPLFMAKQVTDVGSDKQTIVFATVASITYTGSGARGLATSADGWLVTKIDESSDPVTIKHAIGILDNKASLSYT